MLYLLHGDNEVSLREELAKLKAQVAKDPGIAALNITELEGGGVSLQQLQSLCFTPGFFSAKRVVVIMGLGAQVEPQRRAARGREADLAIERDTQGGDDDQGEANRLEEGALTQYLVARPRELAGKLAALAAESELIFQDRVRLSDRNPLRQAIAAARGKVYFFPTPRPENLAAWVIQRVRKKGGRIRLDAAEEIGAFVGQDLLLLDQEIDKVLTYANQEEITTSHVGSLVSYARQAIVFSMVDALSIGDGATALQLCRQMLKEGSSASYLFAMILRQFRILVQLQDFGSSGTTEEGIASALQLHPFAVKKGLPQALRFSKDRLKTIYEKLLQVDQAIKTGRLEPEVALDLMIVGLSKA